MLIEPVLSPLWAWVVNGEDPGPWSLLGGGVILAGVVANALAPARLETAE